ncbi:tRNA A-37 threonylcarbamoyl transferase component Bud32 [Nonomuraea thailandensis]|uniref:non-specific serine/threonine protein kinase n=1 Tax=Nonomuraea thailandensis TaxID=1188745 RepID=A0A9X2GUK9_9ACTN|nr:serine/threonine-protein kinase [Nonomuraea thailandensis]MCP2365406.1 tRNA A-37 threonylcarbamoyl transferase component Bud32 [Nonomuraea thailandensis]
MITPDTVLAGRYRLLSRLGSGGHGEVWRAQDTLLARVVAVKTIRAALADNPEFATRFQAEARSMATIDHPGVVSVFDFGIAGTAGGRTPYLVMQFLDGEPLHLLLARRGRVAPGATMDLVAQAAAALQAVHEAGVVHRDVKPGNLIIRPDGTVALTDFGIARAAEGHKLTASGIVLGTATYCAPEQAEGSPPTPAMDVYALGVVAYECLAGRVPFAGDNAVAIALQHLNETPPPLPGDVPGRVAEVVMRALAKDPASRWPSAAALAAAARALVDDPDAGHGSISGTRARPAAGTAPDPAPAAADATGDPAPAVPGIARDPAPAAPDPAPAVTGSGEDRVTEPRKARRSRRGMALAGGTLAAAIAAALAWNLLQADPPAPAATQARTGETPPSTGADPTPDLGTHTEDETSAKPERSAKPDEPTKPATSAKAQDRPTTAATGLIVGGILHVGGPSSGGSAADGYQPGLVEVFTEKNKRVKGERADQGGFRFALPQGGYRLQTAIGKQTCSTTAEVKQGRTTRADLKCAVSQPPTPDAGSRSATVQDRRGDAKGGPNAGEAPPHADLVSAVVRGGPKGATAEFTTAGAVPGSAPSEGNSRSTWTVSVEQDGRTATVSLTGAKGAWTLQWAAGNDEGDQVTAAAKPVISGARISVALAPRAPLKTAPIDFAKPYRIVSAGSNVIHVFHGWTDSAP